jgi:hypothetical protein
MNSKGTSSSPFSNAIGSAFGLNGKGMDGRTYIGTGPNQNNGAVNSLNNYTAPQFQQQQNPYMNYYAQQQQQRNPYAQTQFGQMPGQYQPQYQQQMPPWAQQQQQQSYYQGPFQQYGMGGKGGFQQQQNPYSQQSYYQGPFQQYGMGGKGGRLDPTTMMQGREQPLVQLPQGGFSQMQNMMQGRQSGMGGKGKGNS